MKHALDGIRVVAFEHSVGGPYCTRLLSDLGAEVVKIERPMSGDFSRAWDSFANGFSSTFVWLNRNKQSLTLNVKKREGKEILGKLIRRSDIFIQNFAPGVVERLGFGYRKIQRSNPRLIYCNISGYGSRGPYGRMKAYDMLVQGESGLINFTGQTDKPARVGISICDISSGVMATIAILAALVQRQETGQGQEINISMFEAILDWLSYPIYCYLNSGVQLRRTGMRHSLIVPYGVYSSKDGKMINFAVEHNEEWKRFCKTILSRPELAHDPEYETNQMRLKNRENLESLIEEEFKKHSIAEMISLFRKAEIPYGLVNNFAEVTAHPQLNYLKMVRKLTISNRTLKVLANPLHMSKSTHKMLPPPHLGQQTNSIIRSLGYSKSKIEKMRQSGII